ncbi:MAG TPA: hypothetical protein VF219_13990, partial [Vicinamibacterales bacterium]
VRDDTDRDGAEKVVIVSRSLAQRMFPNQDAITAATILIVAAGVASLLPAARAARVDVMQALRSE